MSKKIKGCAHLIIRKSKIVNVITHLNKLPDDGVVHLRADKIYSFSQFKKSHQYDHSEIKRKRKIIQISGY